MILLLFIIQIVHNLPVQILQAFNETMPINMFTQFNNLANSSFELVNKSDYLNIKANSQYITKQQTTLLNVDGFCPISTWQPRAQDVHLFLSQGNILLANPHDNTTFSYPLTNNCYSLFQYSESQFAIDCNIGKSAEFQIFDFSLNGAQIVGFTDSGNTFPYDNILATGCIQRVVVPFYYLQPDSTILRLFAYYCSVYGQTHFGILNPNTTTIYNQSVFNSFDIVKDNKTQLNITQIFSNFQTQKLSEFTWNIGFIFEGSTGLYKCLYDTLTFNCLFVYLQMFTPIYFTATHTLNDRTQLVVGNSQQVYVLDLASSMGQLDTFTMVYKDIFEGSSYSLVDSTITSEYMIFTLSRTLNKQAVQNIGILKCLNQSVESNLIDPILKIYRTTQVSQQVYYTNNLPTNSVMLGNQEYYGQRNQFLMFNFESNIIELYLISPKFIMVEYNFDTLQYNYAAFNFTLNVSFIAIDRITVHTLFSYLVCVTNNAIETPYLIANEIELNYSEGYTICPEPNDNKTFNKLINSMELVDGIMGPLLDFEYIPNPEYPVFYPYYLDYDYQATIGISEVMDSIGHVFHASRVQDYSQYDVYESLMVITRNSGGNTVQMVQCSIVESKSEYISQPLNLTIRNCEVKMKYEPSQKMLVDYFEDYEVMQLYIEYRRGLMLMCNTIECVQIETQILNMKSIIRVYNSLKAKVGIYISFSLMLQVSYNASQIENRQELLFYEYTVDCTNLTSQGQYILASLASKIDQNILPSLADPTIEILDVKFIFQFQPIMIVLDSNFTMYMLTQGIVYPIKGYFVNFTQVASTVIVRECTSKMAGGLVPMENLITETSGEMQLIVWCTQIERSYLVQFTLYSPFNVHFYRYLPQYGAIVDETSNQFATQGALYIGIYTKDLNYKTYNIYNPFDFSPRSLVTQFNFRMSVFRSIVVPIQTPLQFSEYHKSTSMALILAEDCFVQYSNPSAQFVTRLNTTITELNYNQNISLLIAVRQPGQVFTIFRQFSLIYNLEDTLIKLYTDNTTNYLNCNSNTENNQTYESVLFTQNYLQGPIRSYSLIPENPDNVVITSQYIDFNKRLGNYLDSIDIHGEILDILDLNGPSYYSLYNDPYTSPDNQNLLVVITSKTLLFLEKASNKINNPFLDCSPMEGAQSILKSCSIRILYPEWKVDSNALKNAFQKYGRELYCKLSPNNITEVIIVCYQKTSQSKQSLHYFYVQFEYNKQNSIVFINRFQQLSQNYLQNVFTDRTQPLYFNNQIVQVVVHSLFFTNSEVGIYQLNTTGEEITLHLLKQISQSSNTGAPYQLIEDFDATVYTSNGEEQILMTLLQETNLVLMTINSGLNFFKVESFSGAYLEKQIPSLGLFLSYDFLQILTLNGIYPNLQIALGNSKHIILINITLAFPNYNDTVFVEFYEFIMYFYCSGSPVDEPLSKPQITFAPDGQVQYLVAACLKSFINYDGVFEELIELYGFPNQNQLYLQLFQLSPTLNQSWPIQILSTYMIDITKIVPISFQIYTVEYDYVIETHLLVSNSTYLLSDFYIWNNVQFKVLSTSSDEQYFTLYANNSQYSYSQSITLSFSQNEKDDDGELIAFYSIILVLVICFIAIIACVIYNVLKNRRRKQLSKSLNAQSMNLELIEEQQPQDGDDEKNKSNLLFEDAIREVFGTQENRKKKNKRVSAFYIEQD